MSQPKVILQTEEQFLDFIKSRGGEVKPVDAFIRLPSFRSRSYFRLVTKQMIAKGLIKYDAQKKVFLLAEEE